MWVQERRLLIKSIENHELNDNFSMAELIRAIRSVRRNSSPGLDGIEYTIIKLIPREYLQIILDIFNEFFLTSCIPDEWRQYQVIFIDKKGHESVRQISLSSCFGKLYERIVNERINWWAEYNNIFDGNQNGFRRGKSCLENLVSLSMSAKTASYKDQHTLAGFLDVTAAYVNVLYGTLIKKLININCPSRLVNMVSDWLHHRSVRFVVDDNTTITRNVYRGLPQGAVLSPILYNIYTNHIAIGLPNEVSYVCRRYSCLVQ